MADNDVYLQLIEMINKSDPHVIGLPTTPAMLKVVSLQFTPEEAKLALQIGTAGVTLSELSAKTGMDQAKLKKRLETMGYKGTLWIDPDKEDPIYRVVGSCAPGLTETGLFGGIRYPYDIELGRNLYQATFDWVRDRLCTLGFTFAPVFADPSALPDDALPTENLLEILRKEDFIAVATCPCTMSHWLAEQDKHCNHTLQKCIHYGTTGRWSVKYMGARQVTFEEVAELLRKCNAEGMVHTIDIDGMICNCCKKCCPLFRVFHELNTKTLTPSPFLPQIDAEKCSACSACIDFCPMGALKLSDVAEVDKDLCIGCAVCVPTCDLKAIKMARRQ